MLGLPQSTEVNLRIPKEKIYSNAAVNTQLRDVITHQIESIFWRNKLASSTFGVSSGASVTELQIFEIQLRQRSLDKRVLPLIAKAMPYKILFLLTFAEETQAWIDAENTFYNTDWLPLPELHLKFEGLNLDTVYAGLARQVAAGRLGTSGILAGAVDRDKQCQRLEREIAALEKKKDREKQFNRRFEMNIELKRLRVELEGLR
jgi:hypothetical protein